MAARPARRPPARVALACAAAGLVALNGCQSVHRRLTVQSDPPGALVLVDGKRVGFTPASVSFDYYGTREITLVKDGFETERFLQPIAPPAYQVPPVDFVSDNFLPGQVEDRRVVRRRLRPRTVAPTGDVLGRANDLRSRARTGP